MSSVTVPTGMSYVNAFHALWENAKPAKHLKCIAESERQKINTVEKIENLFQEKQYFTYVGARIMGISFQNFPHLVVDKYGADQAIQALEAYNIIAAEDRFDSGDSKKFAPIERVLVEGESKPSHKSFNYVGNSGNCAC